MAFNWNTKLVLKAGRRLDFRTTYRFFCIEWWLSNRLVTAESYSRTQLCSTKFEYTNAIRVCFRLFTGGLRITP